MSSFSRTTIENYVRIHAWNLPLFIREKNNFAVWDLKLDNLLCAHVFWQVLGPGSDKFDHKHE